MSRFQGRSIPSFRVSGGLKSLISALNPGIELTLKAEKVVLKLRLRDQPSGDAFAVPRERSRLRCASLKDRAARETRQNGEGG